MKATITTLGNMVFLNFFNSKEKQLDELYHKSDLKHSPDENAIKKILLECLEMHYGTLRDCVENVKDVTNYLSRVDEMIDKKVKKMEEISWH